MKKQSILALTLALLFSVLLTPFASAHRYYHGYSRHYGGSPYYRGYNGWGERHWSQQQYAKKGLIGAGAGAAIGGLMAQDGYRATGAVKGGLVGAGAGLGYEYLRRRW
jgi:hypothetical protein